LSLNGNSNCRQSGVLIVADHELLEKVNNTDIPLAYHHWFDLLKSVLKLSYTNDVQCFRKAMRRYALNIFETVYEGRSLWGVKQLPMWARYVGFKQKRENEKLLKKLFASLLVFTRHLLTRRRKSPSLGRHFGN
jgi:hypothetical protein